ncbi:PorP/SprF family type IX secretion system membrane protein [Costertonia aggregata]|uniref:Type IX secretion system membrane protein PorP/SprF n=1 Tax=Costertonia aggregata TaxID=343403 RepID=A0A7H9AMA9_9FLAO|nr:type IX secretion system membrane protein PorP/SprF [Costertonia aggregata]QLG44514.1 type IX secretion system membrane protein PorP/SprF [Costertonia aggregata]
MVYKKYTNKCGILLFLTMIMVFFAYGQKEPQYTQYMYNIGSFNSAYVGTVDKTEIIGLYRAQWIDIDGAPRTFRFGANIPLANEKNGLGFNAISDQLGPISQTYFDLAYSFQVNVSDDVKLSFGLNAGASVLNVDYTKGDFENPEPLVFDDQVNKLYPMVGAGTFLYADNWYVGLSAPNFLANLSTDEDVIALIDNKIQANFIGGYVFDLSDSLKFKPAFLVNFLEGSPLNINLSTNFLINDVFTVGAAYRWDNAVSGLAGFQISNGLFLGYSYDYNTNALGQFNSGSHEVILKFYLGSGSGNRNKRQKTQKTKGKPKQIDTPRFF